MSNALHEQALRRVRAALDPIPKLDAARQQTVLGCLPRLQAAVAAGDFKELAARLGELEAAVKPRSVTRGTAITSPVDGNEQVANEEQILLLRNKLIGDLNLALEDLGADGRG